MTWVSLQSQDFEGQMALVNLSVSVSGTPVAYFTPIDDEAEVRPVQQKPGQRVPQCWTSPPPRPP